MRKRKDAPSPTETRLKSELERARAELQQMRKGAPEEASRGVPPGTRRATGDAALEARIEQLEQTRERLSKLYFNQLDENRRRASKLHEILRMVSEINTNLNLETLLDRLATTIQTSLGFRMVLIRLREPAGDSLRAAASAGLGPGALSLLEAEDIPVDQFLSWLREDFQVSRSYFISHKDPFSRNLPAGYVPDLGRRAEWEWHPEDVLLVPLFDGRGELVAYFSVDDPVDRLVPSQETVEMLEIFGSHAVGAIENARLYRQLELRTGELEEADRRMKEMNHLKGQFVSTISHELRTPLTAIRAYVDTLLAAGLEDVPPERVRQGLMVINEEGQRLARLIESALDLSRLDSGNPLSARQKVDFGELLEESAWLLGRMAETRQVELKLEREVVDTHVDADRDQMRQLVLHLVSNAIKFTPAGGQVDVRLAGDERVVTLEVEDTGIGIPDESLEKIFDRFYQVDSSLARRYGGTGLGLAICKSIVDWHGGEIDAISRPGEGSRFTVRLPRHTGPQVMVRSDSTMSVVTRDVLRLAVEMVSEVMDAGVVSMMTPAKDGSLMIEAALGLEADVVRDARVRPGIGVAGMVARDRRPMCVSRPEKGSVGSGRESYRTGTFLSVPLQHDGSLLGVLNVTDPTSEHPFQVEDCNLLLELSDSIARAWHEALGCESQRDRVAGTAEAMRRVLEHVRQGRHTAPDRVRLAQATAQSLRLPAAEVALIAFAATVHDVGMTLVDREMLEGGRRLDPDERATMQRHVELGAEVLERLETLSAVREIVRCHNEWWDGSGYPRGLKERQIPTGARVLAVVDAYESMTRGRAHRPPLERRETVAELVTLRGKQFDPDVVDAFIRILPRAERAQAAAQVPAAS